MLALAADLRRKANQLEAAARGSSDVAEAVLDRVTAGRLERLAEETVGTLERARELRWRARVERTSVERLRQEALALPECPERGHLLMAAAGHVVAANRFEREAERLEARHA